VVFGRDRCEILKLYERLYMMEGRLKRLGDDVIELHSRLKGMLELADYLNRRLSELASEVEELKARVKRDGRPEA
jgi:predicted  nucleic acid-binding Zn-ribbon protein